MDDADGQVCANCEKRPATLRWGGDLDNINQIRMSGALPWWCALCAAVAQLAHAQSESARLLARIPELEAEIAAILDEEEG